MPLNQLPQLEILYLDGNPIQNLDPIESLVLLKSLRLHNLNQGQLSDLSPVADLTQLTELDASSNQISDLSPLKSLSNLTRLRLNNNQIEQIDTLAELGQLWSVWLGYNYIQDLSHIRLGSQPCDVRIAAGRPCPQPSSDLLLRRIL